MLLIVLLLVLFFGATYLAVDAIMASRALRRALEAERAHDPRLARDDDVLAYLEAASGVSTTARAALARLAEPCQAWRHNHSLNTPEEEAWQLFLTQFEAEAMADRLHVLAYWLLTGCVFTRWEQAQIMDRLDAAEREHARLLLYLSTADVQHLRQMFDARREPHGGAHDQGRDSRTVPRGPSLS